MKKSVHGLAVLISMMFIVVGLCSLAGAAPFTGTPSDTADGVPLPSPTFGTLIDFDHNQPTGAAIDALAADIPQLMSNAYAPVGVTSITETSGSGFIGLFSPSSQSLPNYAGIADSGGFNGSGTILVQFAGLADKVGIGFSDSVNTHVLSIFGSGGPTSAPLETITIPGGSSPNTYAGFERQFFDIAYFQIMGNFFLIDDLQFESQAVPEPATIWFLCSSLLGVFLFGTRRDRSTHLTG